MSRTWQGIETVIQLLVVLLSGTGWYIATVHIGWEWLVTFHGHQVLGGIYVVLVNALISTSLGLYLYLCSQRVSHSVARYPFPKKGELVEPYPCFDAKGEFKRCSKGRCEGRWAPPRSHHCSTCGVCRLEFDHHCPWIGNCVTIPRLKPFLLLLLTFAFTVLVAIAPVWRVLIAHALRAIAVSQATPLTRKYWWDWPGSWMVLCGPPGRWIVGAILGFWLLQAKRKPTLPSYAGQLIEEPYFRVVAIAFFFLAVSIFALGLAGMTVYTILKGTTTFESLGISGKKRSDLICIPTQRALRATNVTATGNNGVMPDLGIVCTPGPKERLYDLGPQANYERFLQMPLFPGPVPKHFRWPKLNPRMLQRMQAVARNVVEEGDRGASS